MPDIKQSSRTKKRRIKNQPHKPEYTATQEDLLKHWEAIRKAKRIVIKIGTRSLLYQRTRFDHIVFARLAQEIQQLRAEDRQLLLVSSGAVSAGLHKLGMHKRPRDIVQLQVAAAVGNPILFQEYVHVFGDTPLAQILVTQEDLSNRKSYVHFQNTIEQLLRSGIVPIINENDVVSIDELAGFRAGTSKTYSFSDNDMLSALITAALKADVLVILSDVGGLYTANPKYPDAEHIPLISEITPQIQRMASKGSTMGRGGMITKIKSAEIVMRSGAYMVLCHAKTHSLKAIFTGSEIGPGSVFSPVERKPMRELWLLYATNVCGSCWVDQGAQKAITKGASLLLPGIEKVTGQFKQGECVNVCDSAGTIFAKGLVNRSAKEITQALSEREKGVQGIKALVGDVISRQNIAFY